MWAGTITAEMADRVGPDGSVTGMDASAEVVALAASAHSRSNLTFVAGDIDAIDNTYDIVHAHQVLQHLADPVAAFVEMRRVCRPDGVVAARDADYTGSTWDPDDPALDRWLALSLAVPPR